ncbi:hypothetical protein CDL12_04676 [Handroanthus impetiginosus]|uniref:Large ribosomal subunit protein uL22c n=1 Tax=Handroanthus impetiginosus TaxID=429701 RepID=A0A2G9HYN1_9LAMI|nr:hypothetical protein CDL12_04676 [Handroanthus impetiginosus]
MLLCRHISLSADKARRVINQIRGRSYEETLMILELMPFRACYPIFKLVCSAAVNASYNLGSEKANLVISKAEVNEGTTAKKLKPRARGRSYVIKRSTCHITIVVKDVSLDEYEYVALMAHSFGISMRIKIEKRKFSIKLGTTQSHHSVWFAQPKNYFECLQEDKKIRDFIKTYLQQDMRIFSSTEGIAHIEIQKRINLIQAIELTEQADTKGIQIQIAGRINRKKKLHTSNGSERVEFPYKPYSSQIDYCSYTVRTIYGVLGIKFRIFLDKEEE